MKFILAIKDCGTDEERYKERMVVIRQLDKLKALLIHTAVAVRICSLRLFLFNELLSDFEVWIEEANSAYCQGKPLRRRVFGSPILYLDIRKAPSCS